MGLQHARADGRSRFVQGVAVGGHHAHGGGGFGTISGMNSLDEPAHRRGGGGGRWGGLVGSVRFLTRPPARKKLLLLVVGVVACALMLRRAQERSDAFMDSWGTAVTFTTVGRAGWRGRC
jgi:hypothetical protein